MALVKLENINSKSSWILWKIQEEESTLMAKSTLSFFEEDKLLNIKLQRKRLEWLAGRIAVKTLVQKLGIDYNGVQYDQCGKPHLIDRKHQISISHCWPYAAAIIHQENPSGIDIERIHPKLERVKDKFLSKDELIDAGKDLEKLCTYWCAKETLYKVHGRRKLHLNKDICVNAFQQQDVGSISGHLIYEGERSDHELTYLKVGEYMLCYSSS